MRRVPTSLLAAALLLGAGACSSSSSSGTRNTVSQEEFCGLLLAFRQSNDTLSTDIDSNDPATTRIALQRLSSQSKSLSERAPSDIATEVATVSTFVDELNGLFAKYEYDLTKLSADPAAIEQYTTLNDDDVQNAIDQLRAYGDQDCGDKTPPTVTTSVDGGSTTVTPVVIDTTTTVLPGP